jgi:hypothetical protein
MPMPDLIPPPNDAPIEDWFRYLEQAYKANKRIRLPKSVLERLLRSRALWTGPFTAAFLFMLAALALMGYRWWRAANPDPLELGPSGAPCGSTPEARAMERGDRELVASSYLGYADALNDAIKAARADCSSINVDCGGDCPSGQKCRPALSVQAIDGKSSFPYVKTYVTLTYRCRCECLPDAS